MVYASVEKQVAEQQFRERRPLQVLGEAAIAAPMIGNGSATVRNDETQIREVLEQVGSQELHERRGVGVEIVRAGGVEVRIVRGADVDHGGHIELAELFVERVPPAIGQRGVGPMSAGGIGIEVAADEAQRFHAALELGDAIRRRHPGGLRQLANPDEIFGIERAAAVDQIVADLRPREADGGIADVVAHAGGTRREDGEIGAALALEFELQLQALANLLVADVQACARRRPGWVLQAGDLVLPKRLELPGGRGVMAVTINDHAALTGGCGFVPGATRAWFKPPRSKCLPARTCSRRRSPSRAARRAGTADRRTRCRGAWCSGRPTSRDRRRASGGYRRTAVG